MPRRGQKYSKDVKSQPTTGRWLSRRRLHSTPAPEATWHLPGVTGASEYWICPVFLSLNGLQKSNHWSLTSRVRAHSLLSHSCVCLDQGEGEMVFTAGGSRTKESFSMRVKIETRGGRQLWQVHPQNSGPGQELSSVVRLLHSQCLHLAPPRILPQAHK